jgi:glucosylceramidase
VPQGTGGAGTTPPTPSAGGAPPVVGGSGPVATGGGGGTPVTPGPVDPPPSLITSGAGAYWQIGAVTEGGSNANFTVNSANEHQEWYGWGGTFNEAGWDALQVLSEADRQKAINLLFDVNDGIGFDWGRIPIGPSDYAVARYTLSDAPGQFSIDHDQMYLIPYIHAAQAVKGDVKYWASPWTPPPWAKTGTTENMGYDKGIFNTQYYQDYADFFVSWIKAYEAEGIPIDSVMPQNEPGWAQSYPTCAWGNATDSTNSTDITGPTTLGTFVDQYLFPSLDAAGLDTRVWFGTLSNDSVFESYWNDMASKPSFSRIVGGALQWETQVRVGMVAQTGKLVMQSEHKCGNYPWLSQMATSAADSNRDNFLASGAPNNQAYGEESWDLIKSWIDDGVNIYSAWNMVLDTGGWNLDEVRPWPQNAMLAVDRNTKELKVTPYYYVFRHVAQYVDVGAHRIDVNGNALAFKNPNGSIVTIMFNEGNSASQTTLSIDGTMVQFEIPARGWATVNWPG